MDQSAPENSGMPQTPTSVPPTTPPTPVTPPTEKVSTENTQPESSSPSVSTPSTPTPEHVPPVTTSDTPPSHKSSKMLLVVLVILVVAVVLVGAIYFMMLQGNKSAVNTNAEVPLAAQATSAPTATPTPDVSDAGLTQSSQQVDQELTNLDNAAAQATTVLNEQAPNLQ